MTESELEQLSKDALIALVLRLQAELATAQARIAELEERLNRPRKTPENSSIPPSKAFKRNRPRPEEPRKRGPKVGHAGVTRPRAEPDVTLELRVERCRRCGKHLDQTPQVPKERRQVVDIPPVAPIVYEAVVHEVTCPYCGQKQQAAFPPGFVAPQVPGPSLRAMITYLHTVHHIAYQRLQEILMGLFGGRVALGSLVNAVHRVGEALTPEARRIRQEVIHSRVVGSDETVARVNGRNRWHWVLWGRQAVYHLIADSRGARVIETTLDGTEPDVWVSDRYSAQLKAPAAQHQVCLAHESRRLKYAQECGDTVFAPWMAALIHRAEELARIRHELPEAEVERRKTEIYQELDAVLQLNLTHPEAQKLQEAYRKHRDKLFVFLEHPEVPYTNNIAERALRPAVVHRKVTGGFRSEEGARVYTVILTVTETARLRGLSVLDILRVAAGSAWRPASTVTPSERPPPAGGWQPALAG